MQRLWDGNVFGIFEKPQDRPVWLECGVSEEESTRKGDQRGNREQDSVGIYRPF